jgi:hypothetical protein
MTCTPQVLLAASNCFQCLSEKQLQEINVYLLCQIVNNPSGGGGNAPVVYIADPNTEGLKPADPTKPAVAYSADGSGSMFGWNVAQQKWI